MIKLTRAALGLSASAWFFAIASPAISETLADAVARAYTSNPNLRAARAVQKEVDESYVQARAQYGITATANATETYEQIRGAYFKGQLAAPSTTASLQLSQSLYSGGRLHASLNLAEANILAQRETLRQAEIQVLQQVISAYVAVRRDLLIVQVYQDNVQALQRQLQQVKAQFEVRQVTQTDVDQTLGRLALARSNIANAQAQLEVSRSVYLQATGDNPGELAPEPSIDVFPDVNVAFDAAERNNPALGAARYQEQAARARVSQERANFLPNISAQVSLGRSPVEPYTASLGTQTAIAGTLQATQPLYNSGLYASSLRQAKAQVEEMRGRIEVARRSAIQAVSQAWSQLTAAREAISADQAATIATEAAFYGVRREQPFDLRQPIDVLNAEQELNAAQIRFLQDRYTEYVSRVGVLAAAGVLSPEIFASGVSAYRPQDHFNKIKDRGVPIYVDALEVLDSVGAPALPPPAIAVTGPAGWTAGESTLPPTPQPASEMQPLRTATSIMEAEAIESGKPPQIETAPSGRCWTIGGRKVGDCLTSTDRGAPLIKP